MNKNNVNTMPEIINNTIVRGFFDLHGLVSSDKIDKVMYVLNDFAFSPGAAHWTALKNHIAHHYLKEGHLDSAEQLVNIEYPKYLPSYGVLKHMPPGVFTRQFVHLFEAAARNKNKPVCAALYLGYHTGCRPEEIHLITATTDGKLQIQGNTNHREKACHRIIDFGDNDSGSDTVFTASKEMIKYLINTNINTIVNEINTLAFNELGELDIPFNLNQMRYQIGCNLKISGRKNNEIAYLLGCQNSSDISMFIPNGDDGIGIEMRPGVPQREIDILVG